MASLQHGKPHALAVPLPFQGHIQPLLDLSMKLVSAGFMVSFANTHTNHERITSQVNGTTLKATGDEGGAGLLRFVSLEEKFPIEHDNPLTSLMEFFKPEMRDAVALLLACLKEEEPAVSLLVLDFRLMYVLDLALAAGIPSLGLWTQDAANFVCNSLVSQDLVQLPADDSTLFTCAKGVPPLKRTELPTFLLDNFLPSYSLRDEYGRLPFRRAHEFSWIGINTFEELEATTLDNMEETLGFRPLALGPLVNAPTFTISKGDKMKSLHSYMEWLQNHPDSSVLYIAFGTVVDMSELQLEELVLGLEASNQSFLWVFRGNFCTSKKYTLESLSQRLGNHGLLVPWAPQRDVLSHPAIGGFLTHCGWNSTIEGITMGVPMIAWPLFGDQYLNRRCVTEQWGIGVGFEANDATSGFVGRLEVEKKVRLIMEDVKGKEMRQKAQSLSGLAQRAYMEGGSSHKHFDHLKEEIRSFHSKR